jgi:hypothetical protein
MSDWFEIKASSPTNVSTSYIHVDSFPMPRLWGDHDAFVGRVHHDVFDSSDSIIREDDHRAKTVAIVNLSERPGKIFCHFDSLGFDVCNGVEDGRLVGGMTRGE